MHTPALFPTLKHLTSNKRNRSAAYLDLRLRYLKLTQLRSIAEINAALMSLTEEEFQNICPSALSTLARATDQDPHLSRKLPGSETNQAALGNKEKNSVSAGNFGCWIVQIFWGLVLDRFVRFFLVKILYFCLLVCF